jgi:hypothetical protein
MSRPDPRSTRARGRLPLGGLILGIALAACATAGTPPPPASSPAPGATTTIVGPAATASPPASATASPPPNTALPSADAAAWCAFVIDVNTRGGYMVDKTYGRTLTAAQAQAILSEAITRKDEYIALTPPEILPGVQAEMAWYQRIADYAAANGWTDLAKFPQPTSAETAAMAPLVPFQLANCGIKFGK